MRYSNSINNGNAHIKTNMVGEKNWMIQLTAWIEKIDYDQYFQFCFIEKKMCSVLQKNTIFLFSFLTMGKEKLFPITYSSTSKIISANKIFWPTNFGQ